jgi:hypothetical protein
MTPIITVKNEWSSNSAPPVGLTGVDTANFTN